MSTATTATYETLAGLAAGETAMVESALATRELEAEEAGLDERTFGLVQIAVLIALDAPPACYAWQVANALDAGATAEDIVSVLRAIAPQIGGPRVVAAAPEIMLALGLTLPDGAE